MAQNFQLVIAGEAVDISTASTIADAQKLIRARLTKRAAEHRRKAAELAPAIKRAEQAAWDAGNTPGTLLPELSEELDETRDSFTLRSRQDKRAKHAAGGWGCGFDTVEYAVATAERNRLRAEQQLHLGKANFLEKKARAPRPKTSGLGFQPINQREEAAVLRKSAQPSKKSFTAGSWVRWEDPEAGVTRFGVVTCDPAAYTGTAPQVPSHDAVRYIVPSDGGDALAMVRFSPSPSGAWWCQQPEWDGPSEVLPALVQDALFELHPGTPTGTCANPGCNRSVNNSSSSYCSWTCRNENDRHDD